MKPVTTETVKAEIERLERAISLSMYEEFHLNCLRRLLSAMSDKQPEKLPEAQ